MLPCRLIGQCQPRSSIYIAFVEHRSSLLHAKLQKHWTSGSGKEAIYRFGPYMGMAAILAI